MKPTFFIALVAVATACGGGGSGGFARDFPDACLTSSNMNNAMCACMAEKAQNELTADERSFMLAVLEKDDATVERIRPKLGLQGAMKTGMFMTKAGDCARTLAPKEKG